MKDVGEGAVPVDLDECAGVRQCRSSRRAADREDTLREGIKTVAGAKFHVNEEGSAGGHHRGGGRLGLERHNLAVLGQVGDGAGSAMYTVLPLTASPVGTMLSNWINTVTSPSSV